MQKKTYISGKISGMEEEAFREFERAEIEVTMLGMTPINPMKLNHNHDHTWESYMKEDIKALCDCDCIYFLKNWKESRGARIERHISMLLGIKALYQK